MEEAMSGAGICLITGAVIVVLVALTNCCVSSKGLGTGRRIVLVVSVLGGTILAAASYHLGTGRARYSCLLKDQVICEVGGSLNGAAVTSLRVTDDDEFLLYRVRAPLGARYVQVQRQGTWATLKVFPTASQSD